MTDELWQWRAVDLAEAIRTRRISSREAVESALQRCAAVNPRLNAVVDPMHDEALAAADRADASVRSGVALGRLHGVPVTYKINTDYAGRATTNGVVAFKDRIATQDGSSVRNWKAAGAIGIGRTNVPAFCARFFTDNDLHGRTLNPWSAGHTPGGSSGGAAAAIAAGIGALAHGNDRAGSVRYPAHVCGVYGLRPTFGRLPGVNPGAEDRTIISQLTSVQGPLARSIADLRVGFETLGARDPADVWWSPAPFGVHSAKPPFRVALFKPDSAKVRVAPAVLHGLKVAADALSDAGFIVEEAVPPRLEEAAELFFTLVRTEEKDGATQAIFKLGDEALRRARASTMAFARELDFPSYVRVGQTRAAILREWQLSFEQRPLLLMPISYEQAVEIDTDQKGDAAVAAMLTAHTPMLAVSVLGLPGLAVPTGAANGIPIGVQIVAGRYQEELCLLAGEAIEARVPIQRPPAFAN